VVAAAGLEPHVSLAFVLRLAPKRGGVLLPLLLLLLLLLLEIPPAAANPPLLATRAPPKPGDMLLPPAAKEKPAGEKAPSGAPVMLHAWKSARKAGWGSGSSPISRAEASGMPNAFALSRAARTGSMKSSMDTSRMS